MLGREGWSLGRECIIATTMLNADYPSHEASLDAIAREMAYEYRAMVDAGFVLQIDAPDLAMRTDIVSQIERTLAEAANRSVLFYPVGADLPRTLGQGTDHRDHSIYNNWRMEDVWLK